MAEEEGRRVGLDRREGAAEGCGRAAQEGAATRLSSDDAADEVDIASPTSSQIRRLERERDSAIETRDSLSRRLKDAEASLGSDTRLIETNRELSRAQAAVASLSSQYKTVANEREIFETRVKQLESGAASAAEIKREKERKEFMERVDKMEEKIARLETVRLLSSIPSPSLLDSDFGWSSRAGQDQPRRPTPSGESQACAFLLPPSSPPSELIRSVAFP